MPGADGSLRDLDKSYSYQPLCVCHRMVLKVELTYPWPSLYLHIACIC